MIGRDRPLQSGTMTVDLHGMTCSQAQTAIDAALRRAKGSVYRITVIHGYHGGTELRSMIRKVYGKHQKVVRLEFGLNPGTTDLVLREF